MGCQAVVAAFEERCRAAGTPSARCLKAHFRPKVSDQARQPPFIAPQAVCTPTYLLRMFARTVSMYRPSVDFRAKKRACGGLDSMFDFAGTSQMSQVRTQNSGRYCFCALLCCTRGWSCLGCQAVVAECEERCRAASTPAARCMKAHFMPELGRGLRSGSPAPLHRTPGRVYTN